MPPTPENFSDSKQRKKAENDGLAFSRETCLLDVAESVSNYESFQKLLGKFTSKSLNELAEEEIKKLYSFLSAGVLTLHVNESLSDCCLQLDDDFFERCRRNPDLTVDSDFWSQLLKPKSHKTLLGNAVKVLEPKKASKLASSWKNNLNHLAPYFANEKAEKELFRSIATWLSSPNLIKREFDFWKRIRSSCSGAVQLSDLQNIQIESGGRLYEEFKQALDDIDSRKLSSETSTAIFSYLEDVLRLNVEEKSTGNDRMRLVVSQKIMYLSDAQIEQLLDEHPQAKEINIYAKLMMFLDCDLENNYMHGKNLSIVAGNVVVQRENVTFDVSGLGHSCLLRARSNSIPGAGKDGDPGIDGLAGESSGNITIVSGEITNPNWLTVKLCGGNGEGGQNGGRGGNGKKGKGVTKDELNSLCPSYGSIYFTSMEYFIEYSPGNKFENTFKSSSIVTGSQYLYHKYKDSEGRTIEYSLGGFKQSFFTLYDLYFAVYGAKGGPPGVGGSNGVGGEGGRQGDFVAFSLKTGRQLKGIVAHKQPGTDGVDGICGIGGDPGKSGNDIVMIDRSETGGCKYYIGSNEREKLKKTYFYERGGNKRRFNGYFKYKKSDNECFVLFEEVKAESVGGSRTTEKRTATDRASKSKAVSQQTILLEDIMVEFNSCFVENEVELVLEKMTFDDLHAEEEEETEEHMQEELTVVRTQVEDVGAHEINIRRQRPKTELVLQRIRNVDLTNILEVVEVLKDVFVVCLDCRDVQSCIESMITVLEHKELWGQELCNGFLRNGMSRHELEEFASRVRRDFADKLSLSDSDLKINLVLKPSLDLTLENEELIDVISTPLEDEILSDENCKNLVVGLMKGMAKYWVDHDIIFVLNKLHKDLRKLEVLEKFENKDLNWSDQVAVQNYLKSFMSDEELQHQEEEAKVAHEAQQLNGGLDMGEEATELIDNKNNLNEHFEAKKQTLTEKDSTYMNNTKFSKFSKKRKNSQFADVYKYQEKTTLMNNLFGELRKLMKDRPDLKDRFTLELDYKGHRKNVGSHATSLIFMRFLSEQILDFCSKMFRYHLRYRNDDSTPRDWLTAKEVVFKNNGELMLAIGKYHMLPIDSTFRDHMENQGLRSASYRSLLAEHNNLNIQVFCESGYARMRLVENINRGSSETIRLFLTKRGDVTSISANKGVRWLRAVLNSCNLTNPLPLSYASDITMFLIPTVRPILQTWSEGATATLQSDLLLRFLRRLFELRGFDQSLVELQFLLNTVVDLVCNCNVSLEKMCYRLLGPHGSLCEIALALRIVNVTHGQSKPLWALTEQLASIKDKRLQALFGSKLHELNWNKYTDKIPLLIEMLSHADNCFAQLEERPLKEWIDIAECQKWNSFEPLMAAYGTAGYFFIMLNSAGLKEVEQLQNIVNKLKEEGYFIYEKLISRLAFLIYFKEIVFDKSTQEAVIKIFTAASTLAKGIDCFKTKESVEISMVADECKQQHWIKHLKNTLPEFEKVYPTSDRSLEELIKLSTNPHDSEEEKTERALKMTKIGQMINFNEGSCMDILAKIDKVLSEKRGIQLRNTQKIAVLSGYNHPKNLLCQVNTGEGKSYIIASLAILKIMLDGGTVDIITSSSVLAQRDADSMKDIYEAFGIQVGHNCNENAEERKKAYKCAVVYGDISRFERDHLLHNFYKRNILGRRQKDSVLVDEVDSMFLDNGSNMLYLSHNVPGLELLESLFVFLHKQVYTYAGGSTLSTSERIRKAVLVDLFGMITKDDIHNLLLHDKQSGKIAVIWRHLVKNNIVDNEGVLQQPNEDELTQLCQELYTSCGGLLTKRIMGVMTIVLNREREILIPSYLYGFVLQHLNEFVDNALKGLFLQHNDEYVVDVDRSGRTGNLHPVVTIIDKGTGTDLSSSQWSEGLHQFLQLKHGCRLTAISLKAVFVSNVSYLKSYTKINGFSGTLGSKVESDSLRELYNADVMRIPTCKPKEFNENAPVLAKSEDEWITEVYDEICDQFNAKRSVLLICKSISVVKKLNKELNKIAKNGKMPKLFDKAILYQREFDVFDFDSSGGLRCCQLIISTNLAGRGTDIKLNKDLIESGGLHVIVSFLPENSRIEDQAYGRAARCGQPGSGQIIALIDEHASGASNIFQLKQFRDNAEVHRLRSLKQFYDYHIAVEEKCLKMFQDHCCGALASIYAVTDDELPSYSQVIYFALLDEWAMWLDQQGEKIKRCEKNASDTEKQAIITLATEFISTHPIPREWSGDLSEINWLHQPQPLLTLAQIMMCDGNHAKAFDLLQQVAEKFSEFSAEANYYMGVITQQQIREFKKFEREETTENQDQEEDEAEPESGAENNEMEKGHNIDSQSTDVVEEKKTTEKTEGDKKKKKNFAVKALKRLKDMTKPVVNKAKDGWNYVDDKRKWVGNKIEDGTNFVQRQSQKWGDLEDSPEYFVQINEEKLKEATSFFLRARADFNRRMCRKRMMSTIVTKLQQGGAETSSRGYAAQQEESMAVWEVFLGNIDDILGHIPKPSDVLLPSEPHHMSVPRMRALTKAGIISPVVLADNIDENVLLPVAEKHCLPTRLLMNVVSDINENENGCAYEGQKIFEPSMLASLPLPSVIGFWASLRRAGCFQRERFYVAVKKNTPCAPMTKYKAIVPKLDPFDLQMTENNMDDYDLYDVHDEAGKVKEHFDDNAVLREIMDAGLAYMEIIGSVNPLVVTVKPTLDSFDFITVDVLMEELGLEESEANWILLKLADNNMLKEIVVDVVEGLRWKWNDKENQRTVGMGCMTVFVEENRVDLDVFPENIRESLGIVFARHFSYGYALKALQSSLQDAAEETPVTHRILLPQSPYKDLYEDMLSSGILMQGRVTHDLKEFYEPKNPWVEQRIDYLPRHLYCKLSKLAPFIKVNTCKLKFTQEFMREKCVPASAEIRSALSNGMRKVAFISKPNKWRWFFGKFVNVGSFLASCAIALIGNITTLPLLILASVGSTKYFFSMFQRNRQAFAKTEATVHEEFKILRSSYKVAVQKMKVERRHVENNQALQVLADSITSSLRQNLLCQCILTDCEATVKENMVQTFHSCTQNSPLLPMLRETVTNFMLMGTREGLQAGVNQPESAGQLRDSIEPAENKFTVCNTVLAFATTVIIDVNKTIRLQSRKDQSDLVKFNPNCISSSCVKQALKRPQLLEDVLRSPENTLKTVLGKEVHAVLEQIIEEALELNVQPMINQMSEAWRAKNAPDGGELSLDEETRNKRSTEYSAERVAKSHTSDFMERDLQNIFLKICFREQRPEVLGYMIKNNFPMISHCARVVVQGVLKLFDEMEVNVGQFELRLMRKKEKIYGLTAGKLGEGLYRIELQLKEDCFYITDPDYKERKIGQTSGLFEALCVEVEAFATEFSLGSDMFRSRLEKAVHNQEQTPAWTISENWIRNEKLLCPVPF